MGLTKLALKKPVSTVIIIAAIVIFGLMSLFRLNMQLTPDMEMPMFIVYTTYVGVSPEDIDKLISKKVEEAGGTLKGIKTIQSQSAENVSMVVFQYEYGTDMDDAYMDLLEALNMTKRSLPEDASDPTIIELSMNSMPTVSMSISTEGNIDLLNYVEETVVPEFEKITDVAKVDSSGGRTAYISVCLDQQKMNQYGIDMNTVATYIKAANFTMPVGSATLGSSSMSVSISSDYDTVEKIKGIPVTTARGAVIQLSDVANVSQKFKRSNSIARYNGQETISVDVTKRQSAGDVAVADSVKKVISKLEAEEPGINFEIMYDSSIEVKSSLKSVGETLLLGMVLSMVILFIFFGDIKGSLIVGCSMPVCVLLTLILMYYMGFSLNVVTMGGLVIGVGMMVDNSIVVLESCFRMRDKNMNYYDAAIEGTKFVMNSIIASTATTVVVFLPIALTQGMAGQIFKPLGFTIVFSLLCSLISAITLVPLFFYKYKPKENKDSITTRAMGAISNWYGKIINSVLRHKALAVIVALLLLVGAGYLATKLNVELMPASDGGQINFSIAARPGTKLAKFDEYMSGLEAMVSADPDVERYSVSASQSNSSGSVSVYLKKERVRSTTEVCEEWQKYVADETDFDVSCYAVSSTGFAGMSVSASDMGADSIEVTLTGTDMDDLKEAAGQVGNYMKTVPGIITAESSANGMGSKAQIIIDPLKAAAVGFTPAVVAGNVNMALSGVDTIEITNNGQEYKVTVEYPEGEYETVVDLMDLSMVSPMGKTLMLGDIAKIQYTDSPESLTRYNGRYSVSVIGTPTNAARFTAKKTIEDAVEEMIFPGDVEVGTSTIQEILVEELSTLGYAILVSILLVLMLMAMQFESVRFSIMVMWCIPFSFVGSIGLMYICGITVSMVAMMGILLLIGTVVNNGILYVDTVNQLREEMDRHDALVEAGRLRLRPILMTSLTTILAMVPMAIGLGSGNEMMQSMALVIIGGYVASLVLTLLLLPVFYVLNDKRKKKSKDDDDIYPKPLEIITEDKLGADEKDEAKKPKEDSKEDSKPKEDVTVKKSEAEKKAEAEKKDMPKEKGDSEKSELKKEQKEESKDDTSAKESKETSKPKDDVTVKKPEADKKPEPEKADTLSRREYKRLLKEERENERERLRDEREDERERIREEKAAAKEQKRIKRLEEKGQRSIRRLEARERREMQY